MTCRNVDAYYALLVAQSDPVSLVVEAVHAETSAIKASAPSKLAAMGRFAFWRDLVLPKGGSPISLQHHPIVPAISILNNDGRLAIMELIKAKVLTGLMTR